MVTEWGLLLNCCVILCILFLVECPVIQVNSKPLDVQAFITVFRYSATGKTIVVPVEPDMMIFLESLFMY